MTSNELKEVLQKHYIWLTTSTNEGRANLSVANLSGANLSVANLSVANLSGADLSDADLRGADLSYANLRCADLRRADLRRANLSGADLRGADLSGADLRGADLRRANLSGADLRGADLSGADLRGADLSGVKANELTTGFWTCPPEEGSFIGWKKCRENVIVKLLIPEDAKRSSATTRKCRCDKAFVLDIFGGDQGVSKHNLTFIYRKGETVSVDDFDDNRWNECSSGIHFFITREEAECY